MRNITLLAVLMLGVSAGVATAQNAIGDTQTPPALHSGAQGVESLNSMPASAATATQFKAGSDVATTRVGPQPGLR